MRLFIVLCSCLAAAPTMAQRPATPAMTCEQTRALIAARGAVVLSTSATTYNRYVEHEGFCEREEFADAEAVPTRDTPACPLLRCRPRSERNRMN